MQENLNHYKVVLSLGSNHANALKQLQLALQFIQTLGEISNFSSIYESKPIGFISNHHFSNMVVEIKTIYQPINLLELLLKYEIEQGRTRVLGKYTDRSIDIDIIIFEDFEIKTKELTVPHPRYRERDFVIIPMLEMEKTRVVDIPFYFEQELQRLNLAHSLVKVQIQRSAIAENWIK